MEQNEIMLKTGYAEAIFTPPMGYPIPGYFHTRISDGVINDLYMRAIAFDNGESKALYFACDAQGVSNEGGKAIRELIANECGVPFENIIIHASHSHTTCYISDITRSKDIYMGHTARLHHHFLDCARAALADVKPTTVKIARGIAKDVGFMRRYEMKDGNIVTNPRFGHPDIVKPVGTQDESVQLVRLVREGGKEIVVVNFGTHPDTLGGTKYFRDWPGYVVEYVNRLFDNEVHTVMINGCQGNSNHWNKMRPTDYATGVDKAKRMARIISGEVMKIYDSAEEIPAGGAIRGFTKVAKFGQNPHKPEDIPLAKEMHALYKQYGNSDHPVLAEYRKNTGMSVPKANRIIANLEGPKEFEIPVSGLQVGGLSFIAYPGEPFCEIGLEVKAASKMDMTMVSCCSNGVYGYFPTAEAFSYEGGYENNSSRFAHNCADVLAKTAIEILDEMKK